MLEDGWGVSSSGLTWKLEIGKRVGNARLINEWPVHVLPALEYIFKYKTCSQFIYEVKDIVVSM